MNKQELNNNLNFLFQPNANIQVIVYAVLNNHENPRKLDIDDNDLLGIKNMFLDSITNLIVNEREHVVLPLSTADERGKCFYEYDLELPDELINLNEIIGNDNIELFNFNDEAIIHINSLIIVLGNGEHQVSLYKKLSPVEIIGRGSFFLIKSAERFEKFNNNLLRISPGFQAISINNTVIILNLKTIEKSFGFVDVIKREAIMGIEAIREIAILQNIDSLVGLINNTTFARKLIKIAKFSPVIQNNIPNAQIIHFSNTHPALQGKIRYNEDQTLIKLDTKVSIKLFVKLLNDDFLTSELTQLYYDSLAKDDIKSAEFEK
ncbi:anti-phage protein KwaB [Flavobacterium sp.]|uniref:anti-phage protein KwaB n=1 Tax=Flavobacterium sp. TaxID=239 RepID=UPI0025CF72E1|nr:anti-phage protein KwaB [Flavobacterium sp.]